MRTHYGDRGLTYFNLTKRLKKDNSYFEYLNYLDELMVLIRKEGSIINILEYREYINSILINVQNSLYLLASFPWLADKCDNNKCLELINRVYNEEFEKLIDRVTELSGPTTSFYKFNHPGAAHLNLLRVKARQLERAYWNQTEIPHCIELNRFFNRLSTLFFELARLVELKTIKKLERYDLSCKINWSINL
jgi:cob(I)alamin adenosyltransferase